MTGRGGCRDDPLRRAKDDDGGSFDGAQGDDGGAGVTPFYGWFDGVTMIAQDEPSTGGSWFDKLRMILRRGSG